MINYCLYKTIPNFYYSLYYLSEELTEPGPTKKPNILIDGMKPTSTQTYLV